MCRDAKFCVPTLLHLVKRFNHGIKSQETLERKNMGGLFHRSGVRGVSDHVKHGYNLCMTRFR